MSCGGEPPADQPADVATIGGELTMESCTTYPVTPTTSVHGTAVGLTGVPAGVCTTFQTASPDDAYDPPGCGMYITEITNASNFPASGTNVIVPYWQLPVGSPTSQDCEQTRIELFAYVHIANSTAPYWADHGTGRKLKGVLTNGVCTFVSDTGDGQIPSFGSDPNRDRIRVVGKRLVNGAKRAIATGVRHGACVARLAAGNSLVAGGWCTCGLLEGGAVKCWGDNSQGQLGLGDTASRGDQPNEMGSFLPAVQFQGPGPSTATLVAPAPTSSTICVLTGGQLKCWGRNDFGQLGLGDTEIRGNGPNEMGSNLPFVNIGSSASAIAGVFTGGGHTCSLRDNGEVKCWGYNGAGQLGLGDKTNRGSFAGQMGDSLPAISLGSKIKATRLALGAYHTCALFGSGGVKCWGANSLGELGLGDTQYRGDGPGEMGTALPVIDLGKMSITAIAAGGGHTCVVSGTNQVKCWGRNYEGQLGLGDRAARGDNPGEMGGALPFVDLGPGLEVSAVAAGNQHSCALFTTGQVKCWGINNSGQLGLGDVANRGDDPGEMGSALPFVDLGPGVTATSVTAGMRHSCARLSTGEAKCWGSSLAGGLGLGDSNSRGDNPGEMGSNLPTIDLGPS